jgi:lipopolysaccharide export system protein LptA
MKKICLLAMLAISAHVAVAEKADSLKETILLSDSIDIDEVTKTRILTGNVSFTRGTMVMAAAKATVREDVDGNQFVVLTSAPGGAVKFRQKRDGGPDLWVEGKNQATRRWKNCLQIGR